MITSKEFYKIDKEVKDCVDELLSFLYKRCVSHDFLLLLANGEYMKDIEQSSYNPHVIDYFGDKHKDESRLNFFVNFMRSYYSFPNGTSTIDIEYYLHIELMIYSQIWESKPFLKQLYKLANLAEQEPYNWDLKVPSMGKHKFIRIEVRDVFKKHKLKIAKVMTNGFHSQLRNAFAHSDYQISHFNKIIYLNNYNGKSWQIKNITYKDWTKRFLYSALLSYHLLNQISLTRKKTLEIYGREKLLIVYPIKKNVSTIAEIIYLPNTDRFVFKSKYHNVFD